MKKLIRKYKEMTFVQKTVLKTAIGLCVSAILAASKFVIGLFDDYDLCGVAVYTVAILLAKFECVLGITSEKRSFSQRNALIATFLFVSSLIYIGFMCRLFFIEREIKEHGIVYVSLLAFISFVELGLAIAGLVRTKRKTLLIHYITIINFGIALIAILTAQLTILDFTATRNTDIHTAFAGIGVGGFIALCAVYILLAPKISLIGRERNVFAQININKNLLVATADGNVEITLCKSRVYGSFVYSAAMQNGVVDGKIGRKPSLWKRMHVTLKILCCILSEILIFVWFFGRVIYFFRSLNLPKRLEKIMKENGFKKVS